MSSKLFDPAIIGTTEQALDFIGNVLESSTEYSIVGLDLEGKILLWNEGARRLYGYGPGEVMGRDSSLLHVPEDIRAGKHEQIMKSALRDGKWSGVVARQRKDGDRFTASVVITPRRDSTGRPVGYLLISKDITAEVRLTAQLKAAQFYARSLIEVSLDPLVTISPEGKITDVNQATELVTGVPRQRLVGTDFSNYFTEPDRAREGYQQVFSQGFVRDYPLAIRHVSGRVTDVLYNAALYKDDKGKVLGVFAAARDVTQRKLAEELQRASSAYARSLIEASLDPLVTISAEGKITDVNEASVQATGVPREQLIGTDFSNYFTEPEKARAGYEQVFREGTVLDYPLELRHRDGRVLSVLYNASVFKNERGEVSGVFAAARDITARKRTEVELSRVNRALRATTACNQALVHATEEAALLREICRILVEDAGYRLAWVGLAEEDAAKTVRPVAIAGHDDGYVEAARISWADSDRDNGPTGRAIRTGQPTICQDMVGDPRFAPWREAALVRGLASSIVLPLLHEGRAFGALSIYAGESEAFDEQEAKWLLQFGEDLAFGVAALRERAGRRRAEAALRESEQRFHDVLDMLPGYVVLLTPDYHVPFANRFFEQRFGQARGRRCYEYLFNRTEPCTTCESFKPFTTQAPHRWEWLGPDGRNYDVYDFPFTDASGANLILEMGIDITETKQAQAEILRLNTGLEQRVRERTAELEAVNRELEAFAYSVSHDLRAPLRSIDGFGRILLRDEAAALSARGRENLERIRAATQRMAALIDDLLQLSRTVRSEFRRTPLDLAAMARAIAGEFDAADPSRRVTWRIAPALPACADAALMRLVLENLLGNAWKFTSRSPDAQIEFSAAEQGGERVFCVRDNGAGFDMAYAGKLFGAFQRLHSAEEFPGTGIGLATVQRIVHRHGGRVWAESAVGAGARFYFTLPEGEIKT